MQGQFLHISFCWRSKIKIKELVPTFDLALSWIRYAPNSWIVWTTSDANKWYERLKEHLGSSNLGEDTVFICKIDLKESQGFLEPWIWEWFKNPEKSE